MADQLIAEVRAVLHDEVTDVTAAPSLLATVRRRHRRRVLARRFGGVAVPVLAVAVAVAVVLTPSADTTPPRQTATGAVPEPTDAAYVKQQLTTALDGVLDAVVYERAVVTKGDKYSAPGEAALYERWLAGDGSSFRLLVTKNGEPIVDLSRDRVADVFVDHRDRTYRAFEGVEPSAPEYDDVWTAAEIQQAIADGKLTVVGPGEPVNGTATVALRSEVGKGDVPMDLWVDAVTYLPVRWQYLQDDSTPFDVTWLPPTRENVARLTTTIPPDYRRMD